MSTYEPTFAAMYCEICGVRSTGIAATGFRCCDEHLSESMPADAAFDCRTGERVLTLTLTYEQINGFLQSCQVVPASYGWRREWLERNAPGWSGEQLIGALKAA